MRTAGSGSRAETWGALAAEPSITSGSVRQEEDFLRPSSREEAQKLWELERLKMRQVLDKQQKQMVEDYQWLRQEEKSLVSAPGLGSGFQTGAPTLVKVQAKPQLAFRGWVAMQKPCPAAGLTFLQSSSPAPLLSSALVKKKKTLPELLREIDLVKPVPLLSTCGCVLMSFCNAFLNEEPR